MKKKNGRRKSQLKLIGIPHKKYTPAHQGKHVIIQDINTGHVYSATIRFKPVYCGKPGCTRCPHYSYAYAQFRDAGRVREKYLGAVR